MRDDLCKASKLHMAATHAIRNASADDVAMPLCELAGRGADTRRRCGR